ncbi:Type I restriction-modification system, specificity subunit S [uncultured Candidatus Thioglobus sp.]|nr:Type I restriction-modification system, specificity subunit S [uncultured Candidatus Thioglobus sp.]
MGLRQFDIAFIEFAQEPLVRSNFKTSIIGIEIRDHIQKSKIKHIRLKELFFIVSGFAFKSSDYVQEGTPLIRIGDVDNDFDESNMVLLPEDYKEEYERYLLKENDIVVSLTGEGKLKADLVLCGNKYLLNQRVGALRIKTELNIKFYYFLINYLLFTKTQFYWWSNGKTQLNISPFDFLKIKVPLLSKIDQEKIVSKVEPVEQNIKKLKSKIKAHQEVINRVFAREFSFNLVRFEALKKVKIFDIDFSHYGNNKDLRKSVKFHRQAGQFVLDELKNHTSKKIKDFIAEPIVLGKGIFPAQYDNDNGEYYYLSMATIKNWKFEKENARLVTDKFASDNQNKTVQVNDILLARSGEGTIGKVAIINDKELNGIFADFTMRIRLKNYNSLFAYYYFRTEYFQYLVEINKKGLGNNTNIFPSQIQEFPLLDIEHKEQERIVFEIKTELDVQEKIKAKISQERNKIDEIIENAIKNS